MATGAPSPGAPTAQLRFRRSAARLTPGQVGKLRKAFAATYKLRDERGFSYWAGIHGLPTPIGCDNAHGTPLFLPWHRAYLYFFERALRDQVPDATLTWWDWRRRPGAGIPNAFDRAKFNGKPNPLKAGRVSDQALRQGRRWGLRLPPKTRRQPGRFGQLPTNRQVQRALSRRSFLDFSDAVEEIHNGIHVWVGGHMSQIPYAAFDPIFWAHHTMVDRLWRIWQLRHPGSGPPASLRSQALPPFGMTVRQTLDVTALGYDYASTTTSAGS